MNNTLRRTIRSFGAVLSGFAFVLFATTTHLSALSMPTNEMGRMNHTSAKSASCVSLCMNVPVEKQQKIKDISDEQDDEPLPLTTDVIMGVSVSEASIPDNALSWRILKVPLHVLYEVYRN